MHRISIEHTVWRTGTRYNAGAEHQHTVWSTGTEYNAGTRAWQMRWN